MAQAIKTTDHDRIRRWAEKRGGHPAHVKRTGGKRGDPGILRIDFPGFSGQDSLEEISWDQFFDAFEKNGLAFLFQEKTAGGKTSRFGKFVDRATADGKTTPTRKVARAPAARTAKAAKPAPKPAKKTPARKKSAPARAR